MAMISDPVMQGILSDEQLRDAFSVEHRIDILSTDFDSSTEGSMSGDSGKVVTVTTSQVMKVVMNVHNLVAHFQTTMGNMLLMLVMSSCKWSPQSPLILVRKVTMKNLNHGMN